MKKLVLAICLICVTSCALSACGGAPNSSEASASEELGMVSGDSSSSHSIVTDISAESGSEAISKPASVAGSESCLIELPFEIEEIELTYVKELKGINISTFEASFSDLPKYNQDDFAIWSPLYSLDHLRAYDIFFEENDLELDFEGEVGVISINRKVDMFFLDLDSIERQPEPVIYLPPDDSDVQDLAPSEDPSPLLPYAGCVLSKEYYPGSIFVYRLDKSIPFTVPWDPLFFYYEYNFVLP